MSLIKSPRREFSQLKKPTKVEVEIPVSVQDTLEITRIAPNGIFEVAKDIYTKSYLLEDANYGTQTYEEQLNFFEEWCKTLNAMDVAFKITFFNKIQDMEAFRREVLYQHTGDILDSARDAFNDVIETKTLEGKHGIETVKIFTISVQRKNYEEAKNYISTIEGNLFKNLATLTSSLIALDANMRLKLLYEFYHMGDIDYSYFDIDVNDYITTGRDWKNDVVCNAIDFVTSEDYFIRNEKYCTVRYITPEYPSFITDDIVTVLTDISEPSIFSFDYVPVSQSLLKEVLDVKNMGIDKSISDQQQKHNKQKNFTSDISYKVKTEKKEIEEMMDDVRENDQKIFWFGANYLLMADSKKELDSSISNVNLILDKYGLKTETFRMRQREGLNTVLPIGVRQVDAMRGLFTRAAAAFVPFYVKDVNMGTNSFFYGVNQLSKKVIFGNRKKLINGSGFVFGVPGSGKSFTGSKLEIGQVMIATEDDIIIIDPTHEYFDVADAFAGEKIIFSTDSETYFNPFDFNLSICADKKAFRDMKSEKSTLIMGIGCQCMGDEFQSGHASIVDRCVHKMFDEIYILPEEKRYVPILSDFKRILDVQPEPQAAQISLAMERFIDGSLNIFNHQTNIDVDNRILVYGCRDVGEELLNISMIIMLDNITKRIQENVEKGIATWLYVDEFHVFLENPYTRDYFITLWKKIRKVGGIPTGLTQNPAAILDDPKTYTFVGNSEYLMFLKLVGKDARKICETFEYVSEAMLKYVLNAKIGTGLIKFGNVVVPFDGGIDIESPLYSIFNTNFHEKIAMQKNKAD